MSNSEAVLKIKSRKIKNTKDDVVFTAVTVTLSIIILACVLYPLLYVLGASFSSPISVVKGKFWLIPIDPTIQAYINVFKNKTIITGYTNTILYTTVGTLINIVMTTACAYPLSKKDFYGRNFFTILFTITMFFSGGMIPSFLLIKDLHMYNTFASMVLPGAISVWNMVIMRNYYQHSIPEEILEAANVDGCSNLGALLRIVMPLSKSIVSVMVIFYAVGHWNQYFNALLYLKDPNKFPLQVVLRQILLKGTGTDGTAAGVVDSVNELLQFSTLQYAIIVVASLPVLILYPMLQKYFIKGVMVGSIKG
ncbi:MAG: carbohydrate ABC transporter permease [Bacillota bacterium]|nr:carbohydrate ABC transporter permease [Bacillota bacterium]